MDEPSALQERLRSLSIRREQRPQARAGGAFARGRSIAIGLIVFLLVALGGYLGWDRFGRPTGDGNNAAKGETAVSLLKVSGQRGPSSGPVLTATGKIVSDHRVAVSTKVSGQIVALYFEQGDRIERGQILAKIEDDIYRARRDEAAALLEKAKATVEFTRVNFARVEKLYTEKQAPEIEYAEVKRAYDEAVAQLAAAEATLDGANKALGYCQVEAPISGVVLERNVEVGDFVAAEGGRGAMANSQFALIADMEKLRVEVDVSELDIARLHRDMPCVVIPDAYKDRRYSGHLLWIDPGANYAKATVQVKVRIDNPDDFLRVEGAAQVQFIAGDKPAEAGSAQPPTTDPAGQVSTTQRSPGLWVPAGACRVDAGGQTAKVLVVREGMLRETTVKLGRREGANIEVLDGLAEGQEIAADAQKAKDGQTVQR